MRILGIETSCDETSIGIVEDGKKILSNIISSQIDIHKEYGGVVPEIASRHHIKNVTAVMNDALSQAGLVLDEIDYLSVTYAPGLIGALLVGVSFAKGISFGRDIPVIPVHHLKGHIYSNFIENDIELPAVVLIVSGGHTNLVYMDENHNFETMGGTLDDAVGEAYDKIARVIGLGYPGGPVIDRLYKSGNPDAIKLPVPVLEGRYDFSLSGIKTFIINYLNKAKMRGEEISIPDVAASFQKNVVKILVDKTIMAAKDKRVKTIMLAGGVAANSLLREEMKKAGEKEGINVYYPSMKLCTDNGAMVAAAAYYGVKYAGKVPAGLELNGRANMTIEEDK